MPNWANAGKDREVVQVLVALKTYTRSNGIRALDFFRSPKLSKQTPAQTRSAWMVSADYGTDDKLSIDEVASLLRTIRNNNPMVNAQKLVGAISNGRSRYIHAKDLDKAMHIASSVAGKLPNNVNSLRSVHGSSSSTVMGSPIQSRGGERHQRNQVPTINFSGRRMHIKGVTNAQSSAAFKAAKKSLGAYEGTGRFGQGQDSKYTEIKRAASDPTACASDPSWKLLHNWS